MTKCVFTGKEIEKTTAIHIHLLTDTFFACPTKCKEMKLPLTRSKRDHRISKFDPLSLPISKAKEMFHQISDDTFKQSLSDHLAQAFKYENK